MRRARIPRPGASRFAGCSLAESKMTSKATAIGVYTNNEPHYLQATGFLLPPDASIVNAVYSSGPIGRPVRDDVAGMVAYVKSKA
jgi:hypothetical protein